MRSIGIISSQAFSLYNFRGPLIREFVKRGIRVYALAPDYDPTSRMAVSALNAVPVDYTLSRTGLNPLKDVIDFIKLSQVLKRLKLDVVLTYFIKPVIYGNIASYFVSIPKTYSIIEGAGYIYASDEKKMPIEVIRPAISVLYRISLSVATKVFLLNSDDYDLFVGKGILSADKVVMLKGIGIDLDYYRMVPHVNEPVTFIMVSRLLKEKGVYDYIHAARIVKSSRKDVRFLLVGGTDANPGSITEEEVISWVKEGIVEWTGHVDDVRTFLGQASVFILPSYYREGLPRSTQEAMAMGRPVITTDSIGCRETVVQGENGFIVKVRNPEALAEKMLFFVRDPALIEKMGLRSRSYAEEFFDVKDANQIILDAIRLD